MFPCPCCESNTTNAYLLSFLQFVHKDSAVLCINLASFSYKETKNTMREQVQKEWLVFTEKIQATHPTLLVHSSGCCSYFCTNQVNIFHVLSNLCKNVHLIGDQKIFFLLVEQANYFLQSLFLSFKRNRS